MKKIIYLSLGLLILSFIFFGILPDTNPLKNIFGYIAVFALIILIAYYLFYKPYVYFVKWNKRYQAESKVRKEQKKKERMEKWLASEEGQEYIKHLDDIEGSLDSIENDIDEIGSRFDELQKSIKKGEE